MKTSNQGRAFIKTLEGLRLTSYLDSAGYVTIGWGHRMKSESVTISKTEAESLFNADIWGVDKTLSDLVKIRLSQNEWDALAAFVFNIGRANFQSSTLLKLLNICQREDAAAEFTEWSKARNPKTGKKQVVPGLLNRRRKEKTLFSSGIYGDISKEMEAYEVCTDSVIIDI